MFTLVVVALSSYVMLAIAITAIVTAIAVQVSKKARASRGKFFFTVLRFVAILPALVLADLAQEKLRA
jgi:hypothetical protein